MGKANPYVHIPKESFPSWIWYAAACVGLIVIAFLSLNRHNHPGAHSSTYVLLDAS